MRLTAFVGARLVQAIPVVVGVTIVVFFLIHLVPGNPARLALGAHATPQAIGALERRWGLDRSLLSQYGAFMKEAVGGGLGTSLRYQTSVGSLIKERLPVTLWLLGYSAVLSAFGAISLALLAVSKPGGLRDRVIRWGSVVSLGIPGYWLGLILLEYLAVRSHVLPAAGYGTGVGGHITSLLLPSITVAAGIVPMTMRSLRAELLRVAEADFVTTARAKGLSERAVRYRHELRNALRPATAILTVNFGFMVGVIFVIEKVFSLGGVGTLMLEAIESRDFPIVQGATLVLALMVVAVTLLGDLAQALIDPRVRSV